jgi:hypothetical protein
VLFALVRREGRRQHDTSVVDEDICAAELPLHALGGGDDRVAVHDVGLKAPVMTATRPVV